MARKPWRSRTVRIVTIAAVFALVAPTPSAVSGVRRRTPAPARVHIEMRNVHLHVAAGIVLDVRNLRGVMISTVPGREPVFDDQRSYVLHVSRAVVALDMPSLENLMNRYALAYEGAPLTDVRVATAGDRLELKGKLHKSVTVPFSSKASLGTTPTGEMRLHVDSMRAAGIPAKGLLSMLGLELDDLVKLRNSHGLDVQDNDIVVSPAHLLPPPEMRGTLSRVAIEGNRLVQTFDGPRAAASGPRPPSPDARNYIYFSGGEIRFGKLTMHGADLQLIDADPRDAFEFSPGRYNAQLVAGYSRNTPSGGLKTFMPDIDDLARLPRGRLAVTR